MTRRNEAIMTKQALLDTVDAELAHRELAATIEFLTATRERHTLRFHLDGEQDPRLGGAMEFVLALGMQIIGYSIGPVRR
jgi:hypothetical protein